MKSNLILFIAGVLTITYACSSPDQSDQSDDDSEATEETIEQRVAAASKELNGFINQGQLLNLDHHEMAKEEGVYTPPSIATIFSDSEVNTKIVAQHQLAALDLPFKMLCYSEADTSDVYIAWTSGAFISKRHGLAIGLLEAYDKRMNSIVNSVKLAKPSKTNLDSVAKGFGIIEISSDFDFETTVKNLRTIVEAQSDTRWFGEVDFKADAKSYDVDIRPTTLLLFGGPAPGGKAMMTTPKIGLDAFCQKLLVYQDEIGEVKVAFSDIVAFSELYYGRSTKPQEVINQRLTATFTKAITGS